MPIPTYSLLALIGACEDADEIAVLMAIVRLGGWRESRAADTSYAEIGRTLGRSPLWVRRVCRTLRAKPHPLLTVSLLTDQGDEAEQVFWLHPPPGNTEGQLPRGVKE